MTIKFSGLMSRCAIPTSWHAWTAAHIWPNIREMRRRRLRERREASAVEERREGEGGVRSESVLEVMVRLRVESSMSIASAEEW